MRNWLLRAPNAIARLAPARGRGSAGRAQPCQGWGRGFESRRPLHRLSMKVGPEGPQARTGRPSLRLTLDALSGEYGDVAKW